MLRLTPFVAHLMLVMVLNMPEQCSFQDMLFHMLFMPKYTEKYASRMDMSLPTTRSKRRRGERHTAQVPLLSRLNTYASVLFLIFPPECWPTSACFAIPSQVGVHTCILYTMSCVKYFYICPFNCGFRIRYAGILVPHEDFLQTRAQKHIVQSPCGLAPYRHTGSRT